LTMRGSIDGIAYQIGRGWIVSGWALNTADPNSPLDIEILDHERVVAAGQAAEFREDLRAAGIGNGFCAFALTLPQEEIPSAVTARQLSLKVSRCDTCVDPPRLLCMQPLIGDLDAVAGLFIDGWACDTSNLAASVVVELLVDGQMIERVAADQFRHDLAEYGLGSGCYGFKFIVPRPFADGHPHRYLARIANTRQTLGKETEIIVQPQQLTAGLRRLYYLRETARQHLFGIDQALSEEGRKPEPATAIPSSDFRVDSLPVTRKLATDDAPAIIAPKVGPDDLL
jgi:hypothetical protein